MQLSELPEILKEHQLWLSSGGKEGKRAVLNDADFGDVDLTDTNFQRAELRRARFGTAMLRRTNLREADLQNADLQQTNFLLSAQLAGADVAGAKLPEAIAKFEGLKTIAEATSNAQKLFIAMLGGCVYSWLTIGMTKDSALLTNSASSPLPVIGTALPIVGFYLVAPVVLLALYFYFHLNMQRLWEALSDLPAVFPDGRPLDKMADPWLLNGLVRSHFFRLRNERPPLSRMQKWLTILLAWCVVPLTLFVFWNRFLPRHDEQVTALHAWLLAASIGGGWMFYRLARGTLRGAPHKPFVWAQAWKDRRTYKRIAGVSGTCFLGVIFYVGSTMAIEHVSLANRALIWWYIVPSDASVANLVGEDVSMKPPNWTGDIKEYPSVNGAHLERADMQYADARSAFLVNADMRSADLSYAYLNDANLSGANLSNADLSEANLSNADLSHAKLDGAYLKGVDLRTTKGLTKSQLEKAQTDESTLLPGDLPP